MLTKVYIFSRAIRYGVYAIIIFSDDTINPMQVLMAKNSLLIYMITVGKKLEEIGEINIRNAFMRRKEKEIADSKEINEIIKKSAFCSVAMSRNNIPYLVPMNFGFHEPYIYLHSANEGLKIDILKENPLVCIEIVSNTQLIKYGNQCNNSMKYKSLLIYGKAEFLFDEMEKKSALACIVKHYDKNFREGELKFTAHQLEKVTVLKVKVERVTGKKSMI